MAGTEPDHDTRRLMNEGVAHLARGDLAAAVEHFALAQRRHPNYPEAPHMLGVAALMRGDIANAISHFRRALTLSPGRADIAQNLALALLRAGNDQEAVAALEMVLAVEPDNVPALELLAQACMRLGSPERALAAYRHLLKIDPDNRLARHNISHALKECPLRNYTPEGERELLRCLNFENTEHLFLVPSIAGLLADKYSLGEDSTSADIPLETLANDALLCKALETVYIADPLFERFLTRLRTRLLKALAETETSSKLVSLAAALALHNFATEYAHIITSSEQEEVDKLEIVASDLLKSGAPMNEISLKLATLAMYRPLHGLSYAARLAEYPLGSWPEGIRLLIQRSLIDVLAEIEAARSIPSFGTIEDDMSRTVRAMYEENPYPRWLTMGHVTPQPLGDILRLQIPGFEPPDFTDGRSFNILIAGCGTGRHALRAALHYAGAQVLAIDISRRSLGYAKRMAEKLGARNIEFLHIDLFDLPHLGRRFEVIETIGTLETLTFPKRGWQILRDLLVPHGLLHVGSYSELARRPVVMARRRIAELGLTASIEDIRSFRARVLAGELGEDGRRLLSVGDFYTISGCRDFLFHVNEHRFMLADIATLLRELRLTFLGFVQMRRPLVEAYRQRHPDDPAARHLERWAALEINEPEIFTALMNLGMYYYWVQAD